LVSETKVSSSARANMENPKTLRINTATNRFMWILALISDGIDNKQIAVDI
jgi:DNA-binding NarL/FixJ family response regulator